MWDTDVTSAHTVGHWQMTLAHTMWDTDVTSAHNVGH